MTTSDLDRSAEPNSTKADKYYQIKLATYKRDSAVHQTAYYLSQVLAVFLSGITPILIIMKAPKELQAAAPALASIAAGLSTYRWKENWIRCKNTAEEMEAEHIKYLVASPSPTDEDTAAFIAKIVAINSRHLRYWSDENELHDSTLPTSDKQTPS